MSNQGSINFESYEPMRNVSDGLFVVDGEWQESPFRRRMTVIVLKTGGVILHSPIRLKDEDLRKLQNLGPIGGILVPNSFHGSEAPWYSERFPHARVFVPKAKLKSFSKKMKVMGSFEKNWPKEWDEDLKLILIPGTRVFESVFFHKDSKTLVVTDLVFNMTAEYAGGFKKFLKWNQIDQRVGPSRIFRWIFVKNKSSFLSAMKEIFKFDFERVIMNHGTIVDSNGRDLIKRAFEESFGVRL